MRVRAEKRLRSSGSRSSAVHLAAKPRVLVIYKKSAYQLHVVERKNPRVKKLLRRRDRTVSMLRRAHEDHVACLAHARETLARLGAQAVFRYRKEEGATESFDLVVTLGGDGTLLWASHIVGPDKPMVAINTAPSHSVGFFCAGTKYDLEDVLADALAGRLRATELSRMRVDIDGACVATRVLNDALFCHASPAATSRYVLSHRGREEDQKSSGIWIGPAAGSTAAQRSAGGKIMPAGSKRLQFVVREPYEPRGVRYHWVHGMVDPPERLRIQSKMETSCLYLDGPHLTLPVVMGATIEMMRSHEPLTLLGFRRASPR